MVRLAVTAPAAKQLINASMSEFSGARKLFPNSAAAERITAVPDQMPRMRNFGKFWFSRIERAPLAASDRKSVV